jgi:hypothetical protein
MDLAEFVEETLSEVLKVIRAAQSKEGGEAVGAAGISTTAWSHPTSTLLVRGSATPYSLWWSSTCRFWRRLREVAREP